MTGDHKEQPANRDQASDTGIEDRIAEIRQRLDDALPDDEHVVRARYEHGGGRMWREAPKGSRDLIIDAYDQSDREFYFDAKAAVHDLLAALDAKDVLIRRQQEQIETLTRKVETLADIVKVGNSQLDAEQGATRAHQDRAEQAEAELESLRQDLIEARDKD